MRTMKISAPAVALKFVFGIFILFLAYRMISFELSIRSYEKAFLEVEHPENTTRVDAVDLEVDYYPATYVDDSIKFQPAFLVGEIRSYDGDWNALKTYYANQDLAVSNSIRLPVWSLPLRMYHKDQKIALDFPREFSFNPFHNDILQSLREYYNPTKSLQRLGDLERSIYFVYVVVDW